MTTKNSRSRHSNATGLPLTNLESRFDLAPAVRLPSPDSFAPYRSDLNRALSEYNLANFDEAKLILSKLSSGLKQILDTKVKDSGQAHLLYASTLTALGRTCERLGQEKGATSAFEKAAAEFKKWISEAEEPADQLYSDYGVALFKIARPRLTIQVFREVLKRGTLNAESNRYMGICLGRLGKYKEAEERFSEALKQDPDHYMTHKALGEMLAKQGKIHEAVVEYHATVLYMVDSGLADEALDILEHILKLTKRDSQYLALKGEILRSKGDLKGAFRALNQSLKRQPKNAFASAVKGLVLLALNKNEEGVRLLEKALRLDSTLDWVPLELANAQYRMRRYKRALSALNQALARDPGNVSALSHKAETLNAMGRNTEALLVLDEALKLKPDALLLGLKGRVLRHLNRYEKALKVLRASINLDARVAWVHAELGAVLYALGQNEEALQAVIDGLAIQPDNVFALSYKGEILRALEKSEEALQVMNQTLALSPHDPWALGTKGQALRDVGRAGEAIDVLQQSIELDPTLAWVHLELSAAHYGLGHYRSALESLDKALRLQNDSDWYLFKAHILCEVAEFKAAVKALHRAIQINRNVAEAFGLLGWALQHLGVKQARNTLQAYESAVNLEPDNLWWHKGVANSLYLMGNQKGAAAKYRWVVEQARRRAKKENAEAKFLSLVAWCQYRLGKCEQAVQLFSEVISLDPQQFASQFDLALSLICCGRYSEALREYNRGVRASMELPALRCRSLTFVALYDLNIAVRMHRQLAEVEELNEARALLETTYKQSSELGALSQTVAPE
ncbi:MAG TPA: tetratricopeptide repeat protein [Pyrinomonadaceae bacterium]|nr:tetratricopeptide repeat protein [Pyrinomonadaceae bacterium]